VLRHAAIQEAVVVAEQEKGGSASRLVAYVVPVVAGERPSSSVLRAHLAAVLPDYMLPAAYVVLAALPLSASGKLDRGALPAPESERPELAVRYRPPRKRSEALVASMWADVLGLERVGIDDDFFALGGHSLLGAELVGRLRSVLRVELPLCELF